MQNSFSYERLHSKTRFETEVQENSEIAYSVCINTNDNKIGRSRSGSLVDLLITSMIADRIGRHGVLLPINHKNYNLREKISQVMEERENLH